MVVRPGGGAVVLDVAQLEVLLTRTLSIGLDAGRGREKAALVRLRLSKALAPDRLRLRTRTDVSSTAPTALPL